MKTLIVIAAAFALLSLNSCAENSSTGPENGIEQSSVDFDAMIKSMNSLPGAVLTPATADGLVHMREEEKLARDVYQYFYEKYNVAVFSNIASSEARHMAAVKALLDKYSIADPVVSDTRGVFSDQHFANLYTALTAQGDNSLLDAYIVGATIEDLDIKDLKDLLASSLSQDILLVYGNLERGSENHLRAFTSQIKANGGSYTPQYISQTEYDTILSGSQGRSRNGRR